METLDMNADRVKDIIGDNQRFSPSFREPYGYYICTADNEAIINTSIQKYWQKLKYMSENIDVLIQQAYIPEFFDFYGVDHDAVTSADKMCQQLVVDSFVLFVNDDTIGCCLSNSQFMFGHFIDCRWNDRWNLIDSCIC